MVYNAQYIITTHGDKRKLYCSCNSDYVKAIDIKELPEELIFCARCKIFCWYYPDNRKGVNLQRVIAKDKKKNGKANLEPDIYVGKPWSGNGVKRKV